MCVFMACCRRAAETDNMNSNWQQPWRQQLIITWQETDVLTLISFYKNTRSRWLCWFRTLRNIDKSVIQVMTIVRPCMRSRHKRSKKTTSRIQCHLLQHSAYEVHVLQLCCKGQEGNYAALRHIRTTQQSSNAQVGRCI